MIIVNTSSRPDSYWAVFALSVSAVDELRLDYWGMELIDFINLMSGTRREAPKLEAR